MPDVKLTSNHYRALPLDLIGRAIRERRISAGLLTRAETVVLLSSALWTVEFDRGRWFFVPVPKRSSRV